MSTATPSLLFFVFAVGCNATSPLAPTAVAQLKSPSAVKQAYMVEVAAYNDFIANPKTHIYNVRPRNRQLELCYLSAQIVATSVRVPEFASDLNTDGESNEWRRWIDIRKYQLHC